MVRGKVFYLVTSGHDGNEAQSIGQATLIFDPWKKRD